MNNNEFQKTNDEEDKINSDKLIKDEENLSENITEESGNNFPVDKLITEQNKINFKMINDLKDAFLPLFSELKKNNDLKEEEIKLIKKNIESRDKNTATLLRLIIKKPTVKINEPDSEIYHDKMKPIEVMELSDAEIIKKSASKINEDIWDTEESRAEPKTEYKRQEPTVEPKIKDRQLKEAEPVNMERLKKEEQKIKNYDFIDPEGVSGWQKFLKIFRGKN